MTVRKRDGQIVEFKDTKISEAIKKAAKACNNVIDDVLMTKLVKYVISRVSKLDEPIEINDIQDSVEDALMKYNLFEIERAFRDYRNKRDEERFKKYAIITEMNEKLSAKNVINQNANLDEYSFGGKKGEMDSAYLKDQALKYYISEKIAKNHINNRVYIHDLDSYVLGMHNCLSVPMDELLANGVKTRQTNIRPAGSANTAYQLYAVYFQLQSLQQFGGVAGTHLDWTMVPYIRKSLMKHYIAEWLKLNDDFDEIDVEEMIFDEQCDPLTGVWTNSFEHWVRVHKDEFFKKTSLEEKDFYFDSLKLDKKIYKRALYDTIIEVKQASEGMLHNLNSLQSRSGNQLPFSSINYGTCTLPEGRLVIKAILEATIKGTGSGQTSIFPCQIFQLKDGINTSIKDPNYDLFKVAIRCTAKRMYPNYINCDWSGDAGYNENDPRTFPSTMGCRTFSAWDINSPDEEHKHMKDGRGNIAPSTIILPTLAMEAKRKAEKTEHQEFIVDYFMNILEKAISDCKDGLIERFNWICAQDPRSAGFMYVNKTFFSYGDDFEKEGIRGALKHGTLAIGQIGLAETLQILIGCDQCDPKGMELAKKIEQLFKDKCAEFKQEWHTIPITVDEVADEMIQQIEEAKGKTLTEEERKEVICFCKSKQ